MENESISGTKEWEPSNMIRFVINNSNPSQRFILVTYALNDECITEHEAW